MIDGQYSYIITNAFPYIPRCMMGEVATGAGAPRGTAPGGGPDFSEAAAVLGQYADVLAVRSFAGLVDVDEDRRDPMLSSFAEYAGVPVINMESARWHPLQGLADTATWMNHLGPDLRGKRLTLTWAPHPRALPAAVPNQVLLSAALMGMDLSLIHI